MKLLELDGYSLTLELDGQVVSLVRLDEGGYFLEAVEATEEVEDWATSLNSLYAEKPKLSLPEALAHLAWNVESISVNAHSSNEVVIT